MSLLLAIRDFFVPHSRNNHKARLLQPASLALIVALFLTTQFGLNFFSLLRPAVLGFAANLRVDEVIELTNQERLEKGLMPLIEDQTLNEVAARKAKDMFAYNYWSHESPAGRDPWSFFQEVGYQYLYAGENLARDFENAESVVSAWMNSSSHRDNLLHPFYQEIGLAVVDGLLNGVETTLVVQAFGTPQSSTLKKPLTLKKPSLGGMVALAASEKTESLASLSPFSITKGLVIFLLGLILGVLVLDALLVYQRRLVRLSSRNLAHLIFISVLLAAVILTTQGAIL